MVLKEGWLDRQFDQVSKNVESWPQWMKRAAGFESSANNEKEVDYDDRKPPQEPQGTLNLK